MKPQLVLLFCLTALLLNSCSKKDTPARTEKVLFQSDFRNSGQRWWTGSSPSDSLDAGVQNGYYVISNRSRVKPYWITTDSIFAGVQGNMSVEISTEIISGGTSNLAGLAWADNGTTGSCFAVVPGKRYFVAWKDNPGAAVTLYKDYTVNDAVSQKVNVLKLSKQDGTLHFVINGVEVFNMSSAGQQFDRSGFVVGPNTVMHVYYYKAMQLP
ncbi:hypothetical protein [Chitinophaga varians]|uniref:hypothetical protein n=1 Tax=Chitinophaga varians TaxID=2202339 RepID=UPI00165EC74C|nr:hypothetical protein [Chitinophaga varians]MBC9911681.1 hypothetical protein [Chitinophaga varians]